MANEVGQLTNESEAQVPHAIPTAFEAATLESLYAKVEQEVKAEVTEVESEEGRARIRALAMQVSKSKTALDKPMRDYLRAIKTFPKTVEKNARESLERFDKLRDEILAPLAAAAAPQQEIIALLESVPVSLADSSLTSQQARELLLSIDDGIDMSIVWEENLKKVKSLRDAGMKLCGDAIERLELAEQQARELAELRQKQVEAEQRERDRLIAEEARQKAEREAEDKARRDREDAERRAAEARQREEDAKLQLQRTHEQQEREKKQREEDERNRLAAEEQRKKDEEAERVRLIAEAEAAERKRLAEEVRRVEEEEERRAADKAHRGSVHRAVLVAVLGDIEFNEAVKTGDPEAIAKAVITMAAQRKAGRMIVNY